MMSHFEVAWWLGQHLLLTAVLAGVVLVTCRVLRLRPAACHVLWVIVLARLLIPPVATWPWSIPLSSFADGSTPSETPLENPAATDDPTQEIGKPEVEWKAERVVSVSDVVDLPIEDLLVADFPGSVGDESAESQPPKTGSRVSSDRSEFSDGRLHLRWPWIIAGVWFTGSLITALVLVLRIRRVRRELNAAPATEGWLKSDVADWCKRLGVASPECVITDRFRSPFLWCPGRPLLVWPRVLTLPERRGQARPVLVHELAHLKRRDHWTAWLELVALVVWWWNPLFWFVRRQLRTAAEMACDAWVVQLLPEQRRDYAESLLEFSQLRNKQITVAVGADSGSRNAFTRRLEMIMSEDIPARFSKWTMTVALLLGLISLPAFSTEPPSKDDPAADPSRGASAEEPVSDIALQERIVKKSEPATDPTATLSDLAKRYQKLTREGRFAEARVVATQARKKKPKGDDPFGADPNVGADPNAAQPAAGNPFAVNPGNDDPFGGGTPAAKNAASLDEVLKKIESQYYGKVDRGELERVAIEAILSKLDKQSAVLSRDEVKNLTRQIDGQFAGVGIALHIDGEKKLPAVTRAILRSPAQKAGIRPRDILTSIDGVSTEGLTLKELVEKIRGPRGSKVELGIQRGDKRLEIGVERENVSTSRVEPWSATEEGKENYWLDDSKKVGYVHIPAFTKQTAAQLRQVLVQLTRGGATGLVLDLRDCPGGLLTASTEVADLFIDEGVIVSSRGRSEAENRSFQATSKTPFLNLRLAVLVNRQTASAAEIVAACLQDHHRAAIVGQQTFGRGTVQSLLTLSDGSALRLTTAAWLRPNGRTLQRREGRTDWGVRPDAGLTVDLADDKKQNLARQRQSRLTGESGNVDDAQLERALAVLSLEL